MLLACLILSLSSCQDFNELEQNPNIASEDKPVPPSYLLSRVLYDIYQGGGVGDARSGSVFEGPWGDIHRWNQYLVSNNIYYGGKNNYNWTYTATPYADINNIGKMVDQSKALLGTDKNGYAAIGKFLKAYQFIWLSQRVGDIPMMEAVQGSANLTPTFDSQLEVYTQALQLLAEANDELAILIPTINSATNIAGDIYYANNLSRWQKAINTYTLRVLISLSNRADDTPALGIKEKFAAIVNDPVKYPVMEGNADNLVFTYNAQNAYPLQPTNGNNNYQNISSTYLMLTTSSADPRTFIMATPASAELAAGKMVDDFSAYVGADISDGIDNLLNNSTSGKYSFTNFLRYYSSSLGPEPYVIMGYSELNFNIAEGIARGWMQSANAEDFYIKGINASLDFYGIKNGSAIKIGDLSGKPLGTVTVDLNAFFTNSAVLFKGSNAEGIEQIVNQKYIALFENSGLEAFYNHRRTGYPKTFITTGAGINAVGEIPLRWQYPVDELTYNGEHTTNAIARQYGDSDNLYGKMWLLK